MKKLICVLLLVVALSSLLTGCFTCEGCKESKLFTEKNDFFGMEVCDDCMEEVENALNTGF